jgi:phage replication-related protein YjqB (UPF0714/DUF867 family)
MADKYRNFAALSRNEISGVDYRILARGGRVAFGIVAPHGGGIEPGTSEIADAIAAADHSMYGFEGLKRSGNADLHITSTRFDEPVCLISLARCATVVTIHGEDSVSSERVFMGGLDDPLGAEIGAGLEAAGFIVRKHSDPGLQGREPKNVCNRGTSGKGVQLELSRALRRTMFESLSREGRQCPTRKFHDFVEAVRGVLLRESQRL